MATRFTLTDLWLGLLAIVEAIARCWYLALTAVFMALFLVYVPQGREALFRAVEPDVEVAQGFVFAALAALGAMQIMLFASVRLAPSPPTLAHRKFAAHFVPALLGLVAVFLVPLLIESRFVTGQHLSSQRQTATLGLAFLLSLTAVIVFIGRKYNPFEPSVAAQSTVLLMFGIGILVFVRSFQSQFLFLLILFIVVDLFSWRHGFSRGDRLYRQSGGALMAIFGLASAYEWPRLQSSGQLGSVLPEHCRSSLTPNFKPPALPVRCK